MDYKELPVYKQKERILAVLKTHQVIVVSSPTGSGKTTQLPIILHEAGYDAKGIIGVTQPRRIAALSVSEFIAKCLNTTYPGLVGYKMRFDDKTCEDTTIKIMTDGILLQELKLDPLLLRYSVIMVDEAHERSLNIDFVLGLLKRILQERASFKVIISSATLNTAIFSKYFSDAPIVTIDTITYPVRLIYNDIRNNYARYKNARGNTWQNKKEIITTSSNNASLIYLKVQEIIERVLQEKGEGGCVLIFLPGEKAIKECMQMLLTSPVSSLLWILPLYSRLSKAEQEKVFLSAPEGKKKVIIATNIAETSVTIPDVNVVIDTGLGKFSYYDAKTYTTSLIETPVSRASCEQRKGRAGRTGPGVCYRLYSRASFDGRQEYTEPEIYRSDLSEVVLQMADLGIRDFYSFNFISHPGILGIKGAVRTLLQLKAINAENELTNIGHLMVKFPLEPRVSRIIVEAINNYPSVIEEAVIAASFLSASSPFILPQGQELEARQAHHLFDNPNGDFYTNLKIYRDIYHIYGENKVFSDRKVEEYCKKYFMDPRVILEIMNIKEQLSEEVTSLNIPILNGGSIEDYLTCVSAGMIQMLAIKDKHGSYRTLTQERIYIHPASSLIQEEPAFIVAGEIIDTSRTFASSVSPISRAIVEKVLPELLALEKGEGGERREEGKKSGRQEKDKKETAIYINKVKYPIVRVNGRAVVKFYFDNLPSIVKYMSIEGINKLEIAYKIKGVVCYSNGGILDTGESVKSVLKLAKLVNLTPIRFDNELKRVIKCNADKKNTAALVTLIENTIRIVRTRGKDSLYSFLALNTNKEGAYYLRSNKNLFSSIDTSIKAMETLVNKQSLFSPEEQERLNRVYRILNTLL